MQWSSLVTINGKLFSNEKKCLVSSWDQHLETSFSKLKEINYEKHCVLPFLSCSFDSKKSLSKNYGNIDFLRSRSSNSSFYNVFLTLRIFLTYGDYSCVAAQPHIFFYFTFPIKYKEWYAAYVFKKLFFKRF